LGTTFLSLVSPSIACGDQDDDTAAIPCMMMPSTTTTTTTCRVSPQGNTTALYILAVFCSNTVVGVGGWRRIAATSSSGMNKIRPTTTLVCVCRVCHSARTCMFFTYASVIPHRLMVVMHPAALPRQLFIEGQARAFRIHASAQGGQDDERVCFHGDFTLFIKPRRKG
jgi:hypothetical protein